MKLRQFEKFFSKILWKTVNGITVFYKDQDIIKQITNAKEIKQKHNALIEDIEAYNILMLTQATQKIEGNIAELGVYYGGSAKIICEGNQTKKTLFLFDTFEGLKKTSAIDNLFNDGELKAPYALVKQKFENEKNVKIIKGLFPNTTKEINPNEKFCFVHIDADIYFSTIEALAYFYPKMTKGGIILLHDYVQAKGVRLAVDNFFQNKENAIILLPKTQAIIIK